MIQLCFTRLISAIAAARLVAAVSGGTVSEIFADISIVFPRAGDAFSASTVVILKAETVRTNIVRVEFYAGTNLVGAVTNVPFNVLWNAEGATTYANLDLRAIAFDGNGERFESKPTPVVVYAGGGPPQPIVEITSPLEGAMYPHGDSITLSAELLASIGDAGPIEFRLQNEPVHEFEGRTGLSARALPYTHVLTNLQNGRYQFSARYLGLNGTYCLCESNSFQIVDLGISGIQIKDTGVRLDVVTSFRGVETSVERSSDLISWSSIATVHPDSSSFSNNDTNSFGFKRVFYRVVAHP